MIPLRVMSTIKTVGLAAITLISVLAHAQSFNPDPMAKWQDRDWQPGGKAAIVRPELRDGNVFKLTPAQIIYYSAKENDVNPLLLLVKLQAEQSLIKGSFDAATLEHKLSRAVGYGIPERDISQERWPGFYPQLVGMSWEFAQMSKKKDFHSAFLEYTPHEDKYIELQNFYREFAAVLNRVSGKKYSSTPSSSGYLKDFRDISDQHIQLFLENYAGHLKNKSLFSAASLPGPKVTSGNADRNSVKVGDTVNFSATTDKAVAGGMKVVVRFTDTTPPTDLAMTSAGGNTTWKLSHSMSKEGTRPYTIVVLDDKKQVVGTSQAKGTIEVIPVPSLAVNVGSASYLSPTNPFDDRAHGRPYAGQCTWFAWGRAHEATGKKLDISRGDAKSWYDKTGFPKGNVAKPFSVAVWAGDATNSHGHVAFVEKILPNGNIVINEANVSSYNKNKQLYSPYGGGYDGSSKELTPTVIANRGKGVGALIGYIYVSDSAQLPARDPNLLYPPDQTVSRGNFVSKLLTIFPQLGSSNVEQTAKNLGLIQGNLNAEAPILRVDAARVIARLIAATDKVVPGSPDPNHYANDEELKSDADGLKVANTLFAAGIASGRPHEGTGLGYEFYPKRQLSAVESDLMFQRTKQFLSGSKLKVSSASIPNVTAGSANPVSVKVGETVSFNATTDKAATKVVVRFTDTTPPSDLAMSPVGGNTTWKLSQAMSKAGSRPYIIVVLDDKGQVVGTSQAKGTIQVTESISQPKISGVVEAPARLRTNESMKLRLRTTVPATKVEIDFGNNNVFFLNSDGAKTLWTWEKPMSQAGKRDYRIRVFGTNASAPSDQYSGSVQVDGPDGVGVAHPLPNQPIARILADPGYPYVFKSEHTGVDFMAPVGTSVKSMCDGSVIGNYTSREVVNAFLIVKHNCAGRQLFGYYGHIASSLGTNSQVKAGDIVGTVRTYGSNNHHLHFGINTNQLSRGWGRTSLGTNRQQMLNAGWLDPLEFLKGKEGYIESRSNPFEIPSSERVSREQFGISILDAIPAIGRKYTGGPEQRLRAAGIIQADYMGGSPVIRGDAVRMVYRLLNGNSNLNQLLGSKAQDRFNLDADLDDDVTLRQQANSLGALGIIGGYQNGTVYELEPGKQLSQVEQRAIVGRLTQVLSSVGDAAPVPKITKADVPAQAKQNETVNISVQTDKPVGKVVIDFQNPSASANMNGSGTNWTLSQSMPQAGSRSYTIKVMDNSGKVTDSKNGTVNVQAQVAAPAPAPKITKANVPAQAKQNETVNISVQTDKPAGKVVIDFQNPSASANMNGSGTNWTLSQSMPQAGSRSYTIKVMDNSGKVTDSKNGTVNVQAASKPMANVTSGGPDKQSVKVGETVNFSARTDQPATKVVVKLAGSDLPMNGSGTQWNLSRPMQQEGSLTYRIVAYNAENKEGQTNVSGTIQVQKVAKPPVIQSIRLVNSRNADTTSVKVNEQLTFAVLFDQQLASAEIVFTDANNLKLPLQRDSRNPNAWGVTKQMKEAGSNRPAKIIGKNAAGQTVEQTIRYSVTR